MTRTPEQSPVNIDQNRAVGQDSPTEGSRMGREANKRHGYPGSRDIGTNAAQSMQVGEKPPPSDAPRKAADEPEADR
ncbi:hypothetical protein M2165_004880 [Variovorax sp. TBS-050B]|uniref:hypothetical protein n=1 Tax=Variovorax sp. TBS-050B TaxID=2940551 RepID=UPI00247529EA|nr:hypothetical protein [Variovorax sp. TBS-050B]MDH6594991.1 hypothetical protein [Variovorax sp. TBS-050B]